MFSWSFSFARWLCDILKKLVAKMTASDSEQNAVEVCQVWFRSVYLEFKSYCNAPFNLTNLYMILL